MTTFLRRKPLRWYGNVYAEYAGAGKENGMPKKIRVGDIREDTKPQAMTDRMSEKRSAWHMITNTGPLLHEESLYLCEKMEIEMFIPTHNDK